MNIKYEGLLNLLIPVLNYFDLHNKHYNIFLKNIVTLYSHVSCNTLAEAYLWHVSCRKITLKKKLVLKKMEKISQHRTSVY